MHISETKPLAKVWSYPEGEEFDRLHYLRQQWIGHNAWLDLQTVLHTTASGDQHTSQTSVTLVKIIRKTYRLISSQIVMCSFWNKWTICPPMEDWIPAVERVTGEEEWLFPLNYLELNWKFQLHILPKQNNRFIYDSWPSHLMLN